MNLGDTEHLLWRLITAPEGVAKALEEGPQEAALLAATVAGKTSTGAPGELAPQQRLDVYAEAYFARIHGALQRDFSDLAAQLGERTFHDLVTSYLAIHPPNRPSLRDVGQRLPQFLAAGAGGEPFRKRAPWAADLAALEWLQADLFDAPDAVAASRSDFEALPAEQWGATHLRLIPAAELIALDWPVHHLCASWRGAQTNADGIREAAALAPEATVYLVWRASETVSYRPLDESEAEALSALAQATSFGEICEIAADQLEKAAETDPQEAATRSAGWLASWLDDGVLETTSAPT